MSFDLGQIDWKSLGAAVGGGLGWKLCSLAYHWWDERHNHRVELERLEIDRENAQDAVQAELRDELRSEINRIKEAWWGETAKLRERVEELEKDVRQWRQSYYQVVEEREGLQIQNRQLSEKLKAAEARIETLEGEVRDLQAAVPLGRSGG